MLESASSATPPIEIFYVYSQKDKVFRQALENHLSGLKQRELISGWHEGAVEPGAPRMQVVHEHLNSAQIILLLISPDFLASDDCSNVLMQHALERQQAGEVRVIPILLRSVDWQDATFSHLQMLPRNGVPISNTRHWGSRDQAWTHVIQELRKMRIEQREICCGSVPFLTLTILQSPC